MMIVGGSVAVVAPETACAQSAEVASEKALGDWDLQLAPSEAERVVALEMAFLEPIPSDEDIESAGLNEDAVMLVSLVVALRRADPADPALQTYRDGLDGLRGASLTVTGVQMSLDFGTSTSVLAYRVLDTRTSRMRIETTDVTGDHTMAVIRFRDNDQTMLFLEEGRGGQRLVFTRP